MVFATDELHMSQIPDRASFYGDSFPPKPSNGSVCLSDFGLQGDKICLNNLASQIASRVAL